MQTKKTLKRLTLWVLSVAMAMSLFAVFEPYITQKVSATQSRKSNFSKNYTLTGNGATDIVNVALAQKGKTGSQLGYTEAWCANFVSDCADLAGQSSVIPRDGLVSTLREKVRGNEVSYAQAGDIIFYYCSSCGRYKHVGLMINSTESIQGNYSSKVTLVSNPASYTDNNGHTCKSGKVKYSFFRPNYSSDVLPPSDPPTGTNISTGKTTYKVGEMIDFSFSYSNASEVYVLIDANGVRVEPWANVTEKTKYSCSFNEAGHYFYSLHAVNDYGTSTTDWKSFTVYDSEPGNLNIQSDKNCYAVNETINFEFSVDNASEAYVLIDANGVRVEPWANVTGKTTYSCSFNEPGHYFYSLYAVNDYGDPATEWKSFTVYDSSPTFSKIYVDRETYAVNDEANFNFDSDSGIWYSVGIYKNGERYDSIWDVTDKTYMYKVIEPGEYYVYVTSRNLLGWTDSEKVYFNVVSKIQGDINNDGKFTVSDAVLLQKWLVNKGDLTNRQAADINSDGKVNVFDIIVLKRRILRKQN